MKAFSICCGFVSAVFGVLTTIAAAQSFTTFDVSDTSDTLPTAINASGQVTGFTEAYGSDRSYGFVREADGTITTFYVPNLIQEVPGCPASDWKIYFTSATDINIHGEVVGRYMQASPTFLPNCTR